MADESHGNGQAPASPQQVEVIELQIPKDRAWILFVMAPGSADAEIHSSAELGMPLSNGQQFALAGWLDETARLMVRRIVAERAKGNQSMIVPVAPVPRRPIGR